jgi:hypothetical protein
MGRRDARLLYREWIPGRLLVITTSTIYSLREWQTSRELLHQTSRPLCPADSYRGFSASRQFRCEIRRSRSFVSKRRCHEDAHDPALLSPPPRVPARLSDRHRSWLAGDQ